MPNYQEQPEQLSAYDCVRHFVTFFSPGTFVHEERTKQIDAWSVTLATSMSETVIERYGATPYAFQFTTQGHKPGELDSELVAKSPMYWLHAHISTLEDVERRADPKEEILLQNMKSNGYRRVATNLSGYRWTMPLYDEDVVLNQEARHA